MKRAGPLAIESTKVDCPIHDSDGMSIAGSLWVVGTPGHAAGRVVFLWPREGGLLFAMDACWRMGGRLGYPLIFEDFELGKQTLRNLTKLRFENALFGHDRPICGGAVE